MKKRIIHRINIILLLCILMLQACPVSAANTVTYHSTEFETAAFTAYDFQAAEIDFSTSHLYRDQLVTDDQLALYDLFVSASPQSEIALDIAVLPDLPATNDSAFSAKLGAFLSDLVLPAYAAAIMDAPTLFWTGQIGYSCTYGMLGTKLVSLRVICAMVPGDGFSASNYDSACQEIIDVLKNVTFETGSRTDLLRQFHDYLCDTIVYIDSAYAHNIYGALVKGEAVCEGYAKAFKLFCDLYDIPCMLITGVAVTKDGDGPHAWNAVRMEDGNWYGVDVTWDDQSQIYYDFFLIGSKSVPESFMQITFAESHIANADFYGNGVDLLQFPTLAEDAYSHTHVYDNGTVTLAPTCQNEGAVVYACLGCELAYSETLPALSHDFQNDVCSMCGISAPALVRGDCTGDGTVNGKDAARLLRYLANFDPFTGTSSTEISDSADCNGDGVINGRDATRLLQYLANIDPETGESSVTLQS